MTDIPQLPFRGDDGRRLDRARAHQRAADEAERLGLSATYEAVQRDGLTATICTLSLGGESVMVGLGRRSDDVGRTSAFFEALERYWILASATSNNRQDIGYLAAQQALPAADLVRRMAATHPGGTVQLRRYSDVGGTVLEYPALVSNPFVAEAEVASAQGSWTRPYMQYSSSVGTAAGVDVEEARLHATLELIEHDAVSLALLGWFIAGDEPVRVVAPNSMTDRLRATVAEIETATSRELLLIDVTTDLGIPCFLAVIDHLTCGAGMAGSGAALMAELAAERAIQEAAQLWAIEEAIPEPDPNPDRLSQWPALERCMRLDVSDLRQRSVLSHLSHSQPAEQIQDASKRVRSAVTNRGMTPFYSELTVADARIAVVSCVVPGLERFSIVRHGHPVVPTGRGRKIWDRVLREKAQL